jgi:hypothetical protein
MGAQYVTLQKHFLYPSLVTFQASIHVYIVHFCFLKGVQCVCLPTKRDVISSTIFVYVIEGS